MHFLLQFNGSQNLLPLNFCTDVGIQKLLQSAAPKLDMAATTPGLSTQAMAQQKARKLRAFC
ncbi:hypothetical protein [Rhodoferax sp.]|uniref:hypothetical protein n=1 Tax=Rhodoferax sp. TaxID=50421 RepID=UPI003BB6A77A